MRIVAAYALILLSVSSEIWAAPPNTRCISHNHLTHCWQLRKIQPTELDAKTAAPFTKVQIKELGVDGASIVVTVRWVSESSFGREEGLIPFSGPEGVIFALGHVSKGRVTIDAFSDEDESQPFARAVALGTTDQKEADKKTLEWLHDKLPDLVEMLLNVDAVRVP